VKVCSWHEKLRRSQAQVRDPAHEAAPLYPYPLPGPESVPLTADLCRFHRHKLKADLLTFNQVVEAVAAAFASLRSIDDESVHRRAAARRCSRARDDPARNSREHDTGRTLTAQARADRRVARHLGLTLRQLRSGNYRVNFRDGNETTAYYTDKLEDAVNTPGTP
jgi:hypothetical protein